MALKWGIASAGKISHDFVTATQTLPATDHQVIAVAARSQSSADKFAKDHNIPTAYEGYDKLAQDKNVEVVYVGSLNPQHYEIVKLMLDNGKHVLCEKPFTMNQRQTKKLIDLARSKKLFLMEAVWSRCFPAYKELKRIVDSGEIGDIKFVNVTFGFDLTEVARLQKKELGGGTILDLGIYVLQFQQYIYRGLKYEKVVANGVLNDLGTDNAVSAVLTYPGGKMASISTNAYVEMPNEAIVVGTKGTVRMPYFWCPTKLVTPTKTYEYELNKSAVPFNYLNSAGLAFEAEEVRQCIRNGKTESACLTLNETLELSILMDTLREQVGVSFPSDNEQV